MPGLLTFSPGLTETAVSGGCGSSSPCESWHQLRIGRRGKGSQLGAKRVGDLRRGGCGCHAQHRVGHPDTCSAAVSDGELRQVLADYGCCVTPTAAPITTAPPPSPPRPRAHADQVSRRHGAHLRILLGQFRSRSHTTAKTRSAAHTTPIVGRAGAPAPLTPPSQAKPSRTDGAMLHAVKQRPPDALTQ